MIVWKLVLNSFGCQLQVVVVAPFGDGEHRLTYISDLQRQDAINLLKEFLIKAGAEEDWMKHL